MLLGKSNNTLKGVLPNAVTMARMTTPRPNTSERSLTSPKKFRSMKGLSTDKECPSQFRQIGHGLQPYLLGKEGMGKEG
jgi:hypothetical protein